MNRHLSIDLRHAAIGAALLFSSCATAEYRHMEVLGEGYDDGVGAYSVRVAFELWRGSLPVQGLTADDLLVYEDGVRATSESIQMLDSREFTRPVTLLLDTSYSMYRAEAVAPLVAAAGEFTRQLEEAGYDVEVLRFDTEVREASSLHEIPLAWEDVGGRSRWTALYHALRSAVAEHPDRVFVVFSDGADNFSQNHGVESFEEIQGDLAGAEIHTIGFGNAYYERDRQGNRATRVLQQIAADGTYRFARDEGDLYSAFDAVLRYIQRRSRYVYALEYYSPNRGGAHDLVISFAGAETEPIPFFAEGP